MSGAEKRQKENSSSKMDWTSSNLDVAYVSMTAVHKKECYGWSAISYNLNEATTTTTLAAYKNVSWTLCGSFLLSSFLTLPFQALENMSLH